MLHLGEPEFATTRNTPAVAQIQNAMRDARTTFLSYLRNISLPRATAGGGTAVPLSAERETVRFAVRAGVLSVAYERWSSRIFRSLTE
jgi:hypothetical protein